MTNEQATNMLKAKLECLKRETSGTDFDCNNSNCDECPLCYKQGNMGEQKESLDMAIQALEQTKENRHMTNRETENLMRHMKKTSDLEVCEKIIMLAKEVIKENGNHDIRLYAKDSKGRVLK